MEYGFRISNNYYNKSGAKVILLAKEFSSTLLTITIHK